MLWNRLFGIYTIKVLCSSIRQKSAIIQCVCDDEYHYLSCKEDDIVNTASSVMFSCRSVML